MVALYADTGPAPSLDDELDEDDDWFEAVMFIVISARGGRAGE